MSAIALGPFYLHAPVGKGAMGEVWSGVHRQRNLPVAVKVLTAEGAQRPAFRGAFRNEVRAVAGLDHPHIVTVFDHGEIPTWVERASGGRLSAGCPYLVMEWASGGSLADVIPALSWSELRETLIALLDALGHAHARGITHRDLKPRNVLIATRDDLRPGLKLADFGIAAKSERGEGAQAMGGTPAYMAPEQVARRPLDEGPWTDLYALGCLTYQLVTGERPFDGPDHHSIMLAQLQADPPPMKAKVPLPPGFDAWIDTLLQKASRQRFRRAADALFALVRLGNPAQDRLEDTDGSRRTVPVAMTTKADTTWFDNEPIEFIATAPEGLTLSHAARGARRVARTWRRKMPRSPSMRLLGAGLGLYAFRTVPMVDRDPERDALWATLRKVHEERAASAVLLQGPAGCGKSRLAQWLSERAHEEGAATLYQATHHLNHAEGDGLGPMVARHFKVTNLDREATRDRLERQLRQRGFSDPAEWNLLTELLCPAEGVVADDMYRERDRYSAYLTALEQSTRQRPVIVWMDDVQWGADAIQFAHKVLQDQDERPSPILLLLTARAESLAERPQEQALISELLEHPRTRELTIGPLPASHRAELVHQLLGLEDALAARIEERTAGNPLFAIQLVGDWVQRGLLEPGDRGFRLRDGVSDDMPDNLHDVWLARISRLLEGRGEDAGVGLELAAVLGRRVSTDEWREVCAKAGIATPLSLVETLLELKLAETGPEGPEESWSFVHAMLRESLERRADDAFRLQSHHALCAQVLSTRSGKHVAERLGRHLLAADLLEEALAPLLLAAHERVAAGDLREAEALLDEREQAAEDLGLPHSDHRWGQGWVAMSHVATVTGRVDRVRELSARAAHGGRRFGWDDVLPNALLEAGNLARLQGDLSTAMERLEEASRLAEVTDNQETLARCWRFLAYTLVDACELDRAEDTLRKALDYYRRTRDDGNRANCLVAMAEVLRKAGRIDETSEAAEEAREIYARSGSRTNIARCLQMEGEVARHAGDLVRAEQLYREALSYVRSIGTANVYITEANLGLVLLDQGRHAAAAKVFDGVLDTCYRLNRMGMAGAMHACLVCCHGAQGNWKKWDENMMLATKHMDSSSLVDVDVATVLHRAGDFAHDAGKSSRARGAYQLSLRQWEVMGREDEANKARKAIEALDRG